MRTTGKFLKIRSRHPSHRPLRRAIKTDVNVVYRLGSSTVIKSDIEINSVESISNSSNKLLMKKCFGDNVQHCNWSEDGKGLKYPIIAKHIFGSKGKGNYKLDSEDEFNAFCTKRNKDLHKFIFEEYTTFCREYRLHISQLGCFYTCRKLRRTDIDGKDRWKFNNDTCVWILEENESFNKPNTFDSIVEDCQRALSQTGLDIGAFDIRVSKKGDWKIIEVNSAPSLGEIGIEKYKEHLPLLINYKKE